MTASGLSFNHVSKQIDDAVKQTLATISLPKGSATFEVLRYDFVVDTNLKTWLMEVNMSPNMIPKHELHAKRLELLTGNVICVLNSKPKTATHMRALQLSHFPDNNRRNNAQAEPEAEAEAEAEAQPEAEPEAEAEAETEPQAEAEPEAEAEAESEPEAEPTGNWKLVLQLDLSVTVQSWNNSTLQSAVLNDLANITGIPVSQISTTSPQLTPEPEVESEPEPEADSQPEPEAESEPEPEAETEPEPEGETSGGRRTGNQTSTRIVFSFLGLTKAQLDGANAKLTNFSAGSTIGGITVLSVALSSKQIAPVPEGEGMFWGCKGVGSSAAEASIDLTVQCNLSFLAYTSSSTSVGVIVLVAFSALLPFLIATWWEASREIYFCERMPEDQWIEGEGLRSPFNSATIIYLVLATFCSGFCSLMAPCPSRMG